MSICSDREVALKALQAARMSPLVQQCQKVLHDTQHAVGLYWVPGHAGVRENEIAEALARDSSALNFVGPEPALGVSRRRIRHWLTSTGHGGKVLEYSKTGSRIHFRTLYGSQG